VPKVRGTFGVLATLVLVGSVLLSVLRSIDTGVRLLAMTTSFAAYAVLGFLVSLVVLVLLVRRARGRARLVVLGGSALALAGLLLNGYWLAPLYAGSGAGTKTDLTLMTFNLEYGQGDATTVVGTAVERKVDVLVLEEVTYREYQSLTRAGLAELLPHRAGKPDYSAAGTMVFSRYPLSGASRLQVSNGGLSVTVHAARPFRLLAVHPAQPVNDTPGWHSDLAHVRSAAAQAVRAGPTVVAGDFNATRDHKPFRDILAVGLRDAADEANSGWQPTWPESVPRSAKSNSTKGAFLRPLIQIDHLLTGHQFSAVTTSTVMIAGSDHRALVVQLDRL
jgi:endonuclease/exonuclease/phosphatase (EEP) superfamily protein YafD